jgi:hypothetical protein
MEFPFADAEDDVVNHRAARMISTSSGIGRGGDGEEIKRRCASAKDSRAERRGWVTVHELGWRAVEGFSGAALWGFGSSTMGFRGSTMGFRDST